MPGVDLRSETIQGAVAADIAPSSTLFMVGITERGRVDAGVLVRSIDEYRAEFGERVSYGFVDDQVVTYFAEGGDKAYIGRAVGDAPVRASSTLKDRSADPGLNTLTITAVNAGAWGNSLTRQVADGTVADTFDLTISGTPDGIDEVYTGLTSPAEAVDALLTSKWVRGTVVADVTAAPNNNPRVVAAAALAGGTDDRGTLVADDYVAVADDLFTADLGAGAIAIPGFTSAQVGDGLIAHCVTNHRVAILAPAAGQTLAQAQAAAAALIGPQGDYAGLFWPHLTMPAGGSATRTIPPEGYVAAKRAVAHSQVGPWRAGAGKIAKATFIVGTETIVGRTDGDAANNAQVNAIRIIQGSVRTYGWRSLTDDLSNWQFLSYRDLVNDLEVEGGKLLEDDAFSTIDSDGRLGFEVATKLIGLVDPIAKAGGLFARYALDGSGDLIDPGYSVDVGPDLNNPASFQTGIERARVAVRPSPVGELIILTIAKAALTAPL